MCGYCGCGYGKCGGGIALIAGILLLLVAFGVWASWLNLTMFFAIMIIIIGLHGLFCRMHECEWEEEYEEEKKPPKRKR